MRWHRTTLLLLLAGLLAAVSALGALPIGPAGPLAHDADPPSPASLEDRWIVAFADLAGAEIIEDQWQGHRVLSVNEALGFAVVDVRDPVGFHLEDRHRANVAYVERDDPRAYTPLEAPDDPRYEEQYAFAQIQAPGAWNLTHGSSQVNVSVVDTGVDDAHEDLQDTIVKQRDFVADDDRAEDRCGHGTHVAGTLAANTNNGIGGAGTASGVSLFVAKAMSNMLILQCSGSTSDIADAITWSTDQGADVISLSLGSSSPSSAMGQAVDYAWDQGVLLVAAAGNGGECTDCVRYPAARDRVVAVTCTDSEEQQCSFSSQGPQAELAAPGEAILSTVPGDGYEEKSGTSMSTPHVSGAAALALSLDASLSNDQLRDRMNHTAHDLGADGHDGVYGHGQIDLAALLDGLGGASEGDPDPQGPEANFEASCRDLNCTLDASSSTAGDEPIASFAWRLGDGTSAQGVLVDHTYAQEGNYTVNLTVTDEAGREDAVDQLLQVEASTDGNDGTDDGDEDAGDNQTGPLLVESFDEAGPHAFELTGLWHVSSACAEPVSSPQHLAYNEEASCTYDTGEATTGSAIAAANLTDAGQPVLTFEHRWETESSSCGIISCSDWDIMRLQLRSQTGEEWTTIDEWTSQDDNQLAWTHARYDLSEWAGGLVEFGFFFDSRDDEDNDFEGWFVDDVLLEDAATE